MAAQPAFTIRPFTPYDYQALVAIHNATYPTFPSSVEEYVTSDQARLPQLRHCRWIAVADGAVVGAAQYTQTSEPDQPLEFEVGVGVLPSAEGRGIGSALYDRIAGALSPLDPARLTSHGCEDRPRSICFLEDRGFTQYMREGDAKLDLTAFDPSPYTGVEDGLRADGVAICPLADLAAADPGCYHRLYDLEFTVFRDVPGREDEPRPSFERWMRRFETADFDPAGFFVAVADGDLVGQAWVRPLADGATLHHELTGVRRAYRRRGIALALKLRAIAYGQAAGYATILTSNEVHNTPILTLNWRLGFVALPAWVFFEKRLAGR
jgi:GNAT superfamily N-acetyltransferase